MRYFFDTEFIEDGHTITLISLGMVAAADGRELYCLSREYDPDRADPWLHDQVFAKLTLPALGITAEPLTRAEIRDRVLAFVAAERDPALEIWGAWCADDWVVVRQLFGKMINAPAGWPPFCFDVIQWAAQLGVKPETLTPAPPEQHNALVDARWTQQLWKDCEQIALAQARETHRDNSP